MSGTRGFGAGAGSRLRFDSLRGLRMLTAASSTTSPSDLSPSSSAPRSAGRSRRSLWLDLRRWRRRRWKLLGMCTPTYTVWWPAGDGTHTHDTKETRVTDRKWHSCGYNRLKTIAWGIVWRYAVDITRQHIQSILFNNSNFNKSHE